MAQGYRWYEQRQPGLGEGFIDCLEEAYSLITGDPRRYPVRFDSFRRILVRRFPYAVYFDYDDQTVFVYYVFHCSQAPEKLQV